MKRSVLAFVILAACKSVPVAVDSPAEGLVERPNLPPVSTDDASACANANWTAAMACDDDRCVAESAGAECVSCVAQTQACIDERSSGCEALCNSCLGADRCAALTNVAIAAEHLSARGDRGYSGGAAVVHRIGQLPAGEVHAVTPDDLRLATFQEVRGGLGWFRAPRPVMLINRDDRVLRSQITTCPMVATPKGTWLVERCEGETRLYEGRTGFLRGTLDISEEVRPFELVFGGERWLLVRQSRERWVRFDLLEGEQVDITGIDSMTSAGAAALSPDGTRIAESGEMKVWDIADPKAPIYAPENAIGALTWIDDDTVLVSQRDEPLRVVSLADGKVLRELQPPPAGDGDNRVFWKTHLWDGDIFFAASTPQTMKLNFGDGIDHEVRLIEGDYKLSNVTPKQRAVQFNINRDFAARLSDGSYFLPGIHGAIVWDLDRGVRRQGKVDGALLWMNAGGSDEVLIGTSRAAVSVQVSTGAVTPLSLPIDFRLIDVRRSHNHLIALGSELGDEGTEYSGHILLVDDAGRERVVKHGSDTIAATLDESGRLHVIDDEGLKSYDADAFDKVARASRQVPGVSILTEGAPPRALPTQGIFSPDGSLAIFAPVSGQMHGFMQAKEKKKVRPAKLIRTSDHKVLRTWPAISCMFARRSNVYACIEPHKEGQDEDIVVYDGTDVVGAIGAWLNLADIIEVSDDGSRVLLGDHMFRKTNAMFDIERAAVQPVEFGRAPLSFHSDGRFLSFDGTYLELYDQIPAPSE